MSTGKDNLLNAWRTPYGASIFQVGTTNLYIHNIKINMDIKEHRVALIVHKSICLECVVLFTLIPMANAG